MGIKIVNFFFEREFQPMAFTPDNSSLLSTKTPISFGVSED